MGPEPEPGGHPEHRVADGDERGTGRDRSLRRRLAPTPASMRPPLGTSADEHVEERADEQSRGGERNHEQQVFRHRRSPIRGSGVRSRPPPTRRAATDGCLRRRVDLTASTDGRGTAAASRAVWRRRVVAVLRGRRLRPRRGRARGAARAAETGRRSRSSDSPGRAAARRPAVTPSTARPSTVRRWVGAVAPVAVPQRAVAVGRGERRLVGAVTIGPRSPSSRGSTSVAVAERPVRLAVGTRGRPPRADRVRIVGTEHEQAVGRRGRGPFARPPGR